MKGVDAQMTGPMPGRNRGRWGRGPQRGLVEILDLDDLGDDHFQAPTPGESRGPGRLFGGQVASQALRAATLTVGDDRRPHSLHAYFIRPGRPGIALDLAVERTRDGRSFSTRTVTASQDGEPIFTLIASFHIDEEGHDWQLPAPQVPSPEEVAPAEGGIMQRSSFEIRRVRSDGPMFALHPAWVRVTGEVPDDPLFHACALTYISDMAVIGAARGPGSNAGMGGASLDHAVWFHRPVRIDEWLLFSAEPLTNAGARGLATGTFHTREGVLVASFVQEGLLRPAGARNPTATP